MVNQAGTSPKETTETLQALEGLLRWYSAMGVDAAVDDEAHDRFVITPVPSIPPSNASASSRTMRDAAMPSRDATPREARAGEAVRHGAAPASADTLIIQAEASAAAATDLADLAARWAALPGCNLATSAARMVLAGGTPGSRVMLIAGAPEADDERAGFAFAGPRGTLLDAMLRAIGLDRDGVYLANLIPWRPPGARAPTPLELSLCLPFARRHVALAAPEIIFCLGERAAQPLLASREPLSRLRGRWLVYEGETTTVRALATFSPDYLLSQPLQKRRAWTDLQMLAAALAD